MMSKKAQALPTKAIYELVVSVIIVLGLLATAVTFGSQEIFFQQKLTNELALLLTDMETYPGNAFINHPSDYSKYQVNIGNGLVSLTNGRSLSHPYVAGDVDVGPITESLIVGKSADTLYVSDQSRSLHSYVCPSLPTRASATELFRIQFEIEDPALEEMVSRIILSLDTVAGCLGCRTINPRTDATIFIKINSAEDDLVAHYHYPDSKALENKALACRIINNMESLNQPFILLPKNIGHAGDVSIELTAPLETLQSQEFIQSFSSVINEVSP